MSFVLEVLLVIIGDFSKIKFCISANYVLYKYVIIIIRVTHHLF